MASSAIAVLVAREDLSVTRASCEPGERITRPHVHREHTDAFYVLAGELTFEIGSETKTVGAGGFIAVPRNVVHSFHNAGAGPARWLTIHTPDAGFADFIRGSATDWDVSAAEAA
jgi:mannose-6-phosphate isomerase-like protein (cupin superfamily)